MRRMGGNVKLMRKLIRRFAETQGDAVARIQRALDAGDREAAAREAHTCKGLSGNIGATQLQGLAGTVESAVGHGQDAAPALQEMAQALSVLLAEIVTALGAAPPEEVASGGLEPADPAVLAQELRELAALLADDDARAGKLVESLGEKLRAAGQGGLAAQLKKLIGKYEFEQALDKLKEAALALEIELFDRA
jgi:two-component system sensor histidine kinase/response regulator